MGSLVVVVVVDQLDISCLPWLHVRLGQVWEAGKLKIGEIIGDCSNDWNRRVFSQDDRIMLLHVKKESNKPFPVESKCSVCWVMHLVADAEAIAPTIR